MCGAPSRISLEVRLIKAVPWDRSRLKQHFFSGYLCLQTGGGGEKRHMLMENNRLINTGETAGAVGRVFAFSQRPEKCHHDNFGVCRSFQVHPSPPAGGGPKMQVRLSGLRVRRLVIETDGERWEAFVINMFEGEQTSLTPALSGGRALISPAFLGAVTATASCSACHCFVSVESFFCHHQYLICFMQRPHYSLLANLWRTRVLFPR